MQFFILAYQEPEIPGVLKYYVYVVANVVKLNIKLIIVANILATIIT